MFERKYVFESKATRIRRLFLAGGTIFLVSFALIISLITYIPIYAKMQKGRSAGVFFQKSPDAIAVFTGDKGRIAYAMELLKKNPSAKLFISGVYATNSFQTLLDKGNQANDEKLKSPDMQVDLDYESKNTFENVRETVEFVRANPQLNRVLIISSDYHIMRVNFIMSHFMKEEKPEFFFDSVSTQYSSWSSIRKLLIESVKLIRTFFILKVLREDTVLE